MKAFLNALGGQQKIGLWVPGSCGPFCWNHSPVLFDNDVKVEALVYKIHKYNKKNINLNKHLYLVGADVLGYHYLTELCDYLKSRRYSLSLFTHLKHERALIKDTLKYFKKVLVNFPVADKTVFNELIGLDFYDQYVANIHWLSSYTKLSLLFEVTPLTLPFLPEAVDEAFYVNADLELLYQEEGFSKDERAHIEHYSCKKYVSLRKIKLKNMSSPCRWADLICDHVMI